MDEFFVHQLRLLPSLSYRRPYERKSMQRVRTTREWWELLKIEWKQLKLLNWAKLTIKARKFQQLSYDTCFLWHPGETREPFFVIGHPLIERSVQRQLQQWESWIVSIHLCCSVDAIIHTRHYPTIVVKTMSQLVTGYHANASIIWCSRKLGTDIKKIVRGTKRRSLNEIIVSST